MENTLHNYSALELNKIPEFAMNPFSSVLISLFPNTGGFINFKQFACGLHPLHKDAPIEDKLDRFYLITFDTLPSRSGEVYILKSFSSKNTNLSFTTNARIITERILTSTPPHLHTSTPPHIHPITPPRSAVPCVRRGRGRRGECGGRRPCGGACHGGTPRHGGGAAHRTRLPQGHRAHHEGRVPQGGEGTEDTICLFACLYICE